jgi:4-carboxymuconolactone decarboxylase
MDADETYDAGMAVRRRVLGDEYVERAMSGATEFTAAFQEFATRHAWGATWARDGLDLRTRSVVTLAVLTALRAHDELELHVRGALNNGLTPAEIAEILLHAGVYAGAPAARAGFAAAARVIDAPDQ